MVVRQALSCAEISPALRVAFLTNLTDCCHAKVGVFTDIWIGLVWVTTWTFGLDDGDCLQLDKIFFEQD